MSRPSLSASVELLKPITWFAPMWAFGCGLASSGESLSGRWLAVAGGIALTGPLVCATSQAANDWFDRHVDAINEPNRPIPSGRIPGRWGLGIALIWTALSLAVSATLGPMVLAAAAFGLALAWAYSAPPLRLKQNGWWGNSAVAICYEGLPWFVGAALASAAMPGWPVIVLALLYSVGAHGIMTLNDFKSVEGDRVSGIRSLPVQLGIEGAARFACWIMTLPQIVVVALLIWWEKPVHAAVIAILLAVQVILMGRLLQAPREKAPWYNATGTTLYVLGMLAAALAVSTLGDGSP
jgi:chlorophyll synthase